MYGTPDAVIERLQEYEEELGISGVVMEMNYGGQVPYSRVVNSMRLLIEKVVPEFK
jgi:alkanesulfonate monooxygenase SsuD/methylene tetrahydromethanopterin reductase-like flavin-dependent oxidoreductase (luciferase family)